MSNPSVSPLFTEREAAAYLTINKGTLWKLRKAGKIGAIAITNKSIRYSKAGLDKYIQDRSFIERKEKCQESLPAQSQ